MLEYFEWRLHHDPNIELPDAGRVGSQPRVGGGQLESGRYRIAGQMVQELALLLSSNQVRRGQSQIVQVSEATWTQRILQLPSAYRPALLVS